jgi:urease accessory protein
MVTPIPTTITRVNLKVDLNDQDRALLRLMQLASPTLPVGAYSYSEGLETLVDRGQITSAKDLDDWLMAELTYGSVRIDGALLLRAYQATKARDFGRLTDWNAWLSAARESEELRSQSLQMGRSLLKLAADLHWITDAQLPLIRFQTDGCHFAIAFGAIAAIWELDTRSALLAYLQSWGNNLIAAGIKLIPLGQTAGQRILLELSDRLPEISDRIAQLADVDLTSSTWGLSIASMGHEIQYSRLFRS